MYKLIALLLLALQLEGSPDLSVRRMQAHLLIGDPRSAVLEAKAALEKYSQDPLIYEWAIRSLANCGAEGEMMEIWQRLRILDEKRALEPDLVEEMGWGILKVGQKASSLSAQLICLIGSALTQDIRAVPFLLQGLRHSNAQIRAASVELAAHYGDHPLREEICRLYKEERVLDVRLAVIEALGRLHIEEYIPNLLGLIGDPKSGPREKLAAIGAIVAMRDKIDKVELESLATCPRAGLRQLACEVIATCVLEDEYALLIPLIADPQPEVSAAAIKTWGFLRKPATNKIKQLAVEALDPTVGVTAAWVWLIDEPQAGQKAMLRWLQHEKSHVRALAASAVAAAGPYGIELAKNWIERTQDIYVRANLAMALVWQREESSLACKLLEEALQKGSDRWMISENGPFATLERSTLSHNASIPNYPEVVNQTVRLEILNLLAILESPTALDAIKTFLKERKWGVTGLAAETLLGEGDETAIEIVRELLQDADPQIRLESALVLASWGRDDAATNTLLEVYPGADRQLQLKILESLGRIGDKKAIPFLMERFKEPSLILRLAAASVLIQTLHK